MGVCLSKTCWSKSCLSKTSVKWENSPKFNYNYLSINNKTCRITKVIDGDTYWIAIKIPKIKKIYQFKLRLFNCDAPELTKRCAKSDDERIAGNLVKKYVTDLIEHNEYNLILSDEKDKYGRLIGDLQLTRNETLSQHLINRKYVKPYSGGTKGWEDRELKQIILELKEYIAFQKMNI